jgi:hypothetical protein
MTPPTAHRDANPAAHHRRTLAVEYIEGQWLWLDLEITMLMSPRFVADRSCVG